jgi:hypothetical protein
MALQATFRPLGAWPGKETPAYSRKHATFRVGYADRLNLLEYELAKLNAKDIVVQAQFELKDIRQDGWPRSSARTKGPAVVVSFKSSTGPLSFPCDRYDAWEDNLYAIALSLEALRAVDRYGVTRNAEQYRGWTQLPPPASKSDTFMDAKQAATWLVFVSDCSFTAEFLVANEGARDAAYRRAAKKLHPDVAGGSTEQFQRLQAAMRLLRGGR